MWESVCSNGANILPCWDFKTREPGDYALLSTDYNKSTTKEDFLAAQAVTAFFGTFVLSSLVRAHADARTQCNTECQSLTAVDCRF